MLKEMRKWGEGRDLAAILCQTEASQLLIALILVA